MIELLKKIQKGTAGWRTPAKMWTFFLLGNLAWFGIMPGEIHYYVYHQQHGFYPSYADTIAIPIYQTFAGLIILSPFLNGIAWLIMSRCKIPAPLFHLSKDHPRLDLILSSIFGALIVFVLYSYIAYDVIETFLLRMPDLLLQFYLLLSVRAGLLNFADAKGAQSQVT